MSADFAHSIAFQIWAVCLVVLFCKMFALSVLQGIGRVLSGKFTRPEDAVLFADGEVAKRDVPLVARAAQCWRNDLENIPIFLLVALGFVLAGGPDSWAMFYCVTFTVCRVLHSVFYLCAMQPHRTIIYSVGACIAFMVAGHLVALIHA